MYLNRLLKLGRHLGKQHLNDEAYKRAKIYNCSKADCNIEHFAFAIAELPKIASKHWIVNEHGHPCLASHPQLNSLTAAGYYFNLTADELMHLMVPGYQDPIFMGMALGENSTPSDISNNIYEFVSVKEADVVIESLQLNIKNCEEKKINKKYKYKTAA